MNYDVQEIAAACERNMRRLDAVASNVANVGTPGFKQEYLIVLEQLDKGRSGTSGTYPAMETVAIDFRPGLIKQTGNALDLAVGGEGFFTIQTASGPAYTRKGDFTRDGNGYLVTQTGEKVLGEGGPLQINGQLIDIENDGTVIVDGTSLGRLSIVSFANLKELKRGAGGYFQSEEKAVKVDNPLIKQAHIEMSNVNVIREMVNMIDIQRTLESYQKMMQTISDEDKQATSRVGKLV